LELARCITGQNGFPVGLAAVDYDPLGSAMPLERLAQKPLGGREVSPFAEPETDRVAIAIDGAIEIPPLAADLDVSLVDVPLADDGALPKVKALQQLGRLVNDPSVNGRVVDAISRSAIISSKFRRLRT
jgi:hypothetical protein